MKFCGKAVSVWLKRLHLKDKSVVGFGLIRRFVGNNRIK